MNHSGASETSAHSHSAVRDALPLVVEEHPLVFRIEQRFERFDRLPHARAQCAGRERSAETLPIEVVDIDDGWNGHTVRVFESRHRRLARRRLRHFGLRGQLFPVEFRRHGP
jgi:hypothetical protein